MKRMQSLTVRGLLTLLLCAGLSVPAWAETYALAEPEPVPVETEVYTLAQPDIEPVSVDPDEQSAPDVEAMPPETDTVKNTADSVTRESVPVRTEGADVSREYTVSAEETFEYTAEQIPAYDSGTDAFLGYLEARGGVYREARTLSAAGTTLSGLNAWLYGHLRDAVSEIAAGRVHSTEIIFTGEELEQSGFVMHQDNLPTTSNFAAIANGLIEDAGFDYTSLQDALVTDCPYELYWFNKTVGMEQAMSYGYTIVGNRVTLSVNELTFSFPVANAYRASANNDYQVRDGLDSLIDTVVSTAAGIVAESAAQPDYLKLTAYKNAIDDLVEYNTAAASNAFTPYGDPWQIMYVFDGDPETNVVCEGYAKAFQYLCDLSSFRGDTDCYTITGFMSRNAGSGEAHMWNIAKLYGKYYLVDLTNCDGFTQHTYGASYSVGYPDKLFLKAVIHSPENRGYTARFNDYGGTLATVYYTNAESPYAENSLLMMPSTRDFEPPVPLTTADFTVTFPAGSVISDSVRPPYARTAYDETEKPVSVTWADPVLQTQAGDITVVYGYVEQQDGPDPRSALSDIPPVTEGEYKIYAQTSGGSHYAAIDPDETLLHIGTLFIGDEPAPPEPRMLTVTLTGPHDNETRDFTIPYVENASCWYALYGKNDRLLALGRLIFDDDDKTTVTHPEAGEAAEKIQFFAVSEDWTPLTESVGEELGGGGVRIVRPPILSETYAPAKD